MRHFVPYDASQPFFQILPFSAVHLHTLTQTDPAVFFATHLLGGFCSLVPLFVAKDAIALVEQHLAFPREGKDVYGAYGFCAQ